MSERQETRTLMDEYNALSRSTSYSDKLRAAAIQKDAEKDTAMAEIFRKLSAQLEFAAPDDEAVEETREELSKMIQARSRNKFMSYHELMFDEEVLALSGGEVTRASSVDFDLTEWVKDGLHDPAIFGGCGSIPYYDKDTGMFTPEKPFTLRFGHINLPCLIAPKTAAHDIALLTHLSDDDVNKIMSYQAYVQFNEDGSSEVLEAKEGDKLSGQANVLTGGEAIHELLVRLNLPDHPERITFKVLPVLPTACRPTGIIKGCWKYPISDLDDLYVQILNRVNRIKRLMPLDAPEVIMRNERRVLSEKIDMLFDAISEQASPKKSRKRPPNLRYLYLGTRHRIIGQEREPLVGDSEIIPWANYAGTIPVEMPDGSTTDMPMRDVLQRLGEASMEEMSNCDEDETDEENSNPSGDLLDAIQLAANEGSPLPKVKTDGKSFFAVSEVA